MVQRSTDIVSLRGDLNGRILYHPTSVFDFTNDTLVNTGTQVFSGTVLGSDPVILHDDQFRPTMSMSATLAERAHTNMVEAFASLSAHQDGGFVRPAEHVGGPWQTGGPPRRRPGHPG